MTVATTNVSNSFTGDGVTLSFNYTFASQNAADIQVFLGGILQTTGYIVSPNTNSDLSTGVGGSVTFLSTPPVAGISGLIANAVPLTQDLSIPNEGAFDEVAITNELDRMVMMIQQNRNISSGLALSIPLQYQNIFNPIIAPPLTALYIMRVNAAGTGFEFVSPAQALMQAAPVPGGGTVVNTNVGAITAGRLAYASDTTGQLINYIDDTGAAAGYVPQFVAPGSPPVWAAPSGGGGSGASFEYQLGVNTALTTGVTTTLITGTPAVAGTYLAIGQLLLELGSGGQVNVALTPTGGPTIAIPIQGSYDGFDAWVTVVIMGIVVFGTSAGSIELQAHPTALGGSATAAVQPTPVPFGATGATRLELIRIA